MNNRVLSLIRRFSLIPPVIIQAPMAGGITTPKLVAAVSNAYGIGSFASGYLTPEQVTSGIREIKQLTTRPFGVNLFIPNKLEEKSSENTLEYQLALNYFRQKLGMQEENNVSQDIIPNDNFREIVDILLKEDVQIVSFTFGNLPREFIDLFKQKGVFLIGTATSVEEAQMLSASGVDAVVAQGYEAGGHRGNFLTPFKQSLTGTIALIPQITKAIQQPVIAAGGIMDGNGIVAAMALGASAVQIGTAFISTNESGASVAYKSALQRLKTAKKDETVLTSAYSGKMARGIYTDFIRYIEAHTRSLPPYPIPHYLSSIIRKEAANQNKTDMLSLWSGQGGPLVTHGLSAVKLIDHWREEVQECINERLSLITSSKLNSRR